MSPQRILVVDDEADIRGLLSEILAEEGYEIEVAADAASARRAAARQEPDLVLLDIWMPDMDGISLLREWNDALPEGASRSAQASRATVTPCSVSRLAYWLTKKYRYWCDWSGMTLKSPTPPTKYLFALAQSVDCGDEANTTPRFCHVAPWSCDLAAPIRGMVR